MDPVEVVHRLPILSDSITNLSNTRDGSAVVDSLSYKQEPNELCLREKRRGDAENSGDNGNAVVLHASRSRAESTGEMAIPADVTPMDIEIEIPVDVGARSHEQQVKRLSDVAEMDIEIEIPAVIGARSQEQEILVISTPKEDSDHLGSRILHPAGNSDAEGIDIEVVVQNARPNGGQSQLVELGKEGQGEHPTSAAVVVEAVGLETLGGSSIIVEEAGTQRGDETSVLSYGLEIDTTIVGAGETVRTTVIPVEHDREDGGAHEEKMQQFTVKAESLQESPIPVVELENVAEVVIRKVHSPDTEAIASFEDRVKIDLSVEANNLTAKQLEENRDVRPIEGASVDLGPTMAVTLPTYGEAMIEGLVSGNGDILVEESSGNAVEAGILNHQPTSEGRDSYVNSASQFVSPATVSEAGDLSISRMKGISGAESSSAVEVKAPSEGDGLAGSGQPPVSEQEVDRNLFSSEGRSIVIELNNFFISGETKTKDTLDTVFLPAGEPRLVTGEAPSADDLVIPNADGSSIVDFGASSELNTSENNADIVVQLDEGPRQNNGVDFLPGRDSTRKSCLFPIAGSGNASVGVGPAEKATLGDLDSGDRPSADMRGMSADETSIMTVLGNKSAFTITGDEKKAEDVGTKVMPGEPEGLLKENGDLTVVNAISVKENDIVLSIKQNAAEEKTLVVSAGTTDIVGTREVSSLEDQERVDVKLRAEEEYMGSVVETSTQTETGRSIAEGLVTKVQNHTEMQNTKRTEAAGMFQKIVVPALEEGIHTVTTAENVSDCVVKNVEKDTEIGSTERRETAETVAEMVVPAFEGGIATVTTAVETAATEKLPGVVMKKVGDDNEMENTEKTDTAETFSKMAVQQFEDNFTSAAETRKTQNVECVVEDTEMENAETTVTVEAFPEISISNVATFVEVAVEKAITMERVEPMTLDAITESGSEDIVSVQEEIIHTSIHIMGDNEEDNGGVLIGVGSSVENSGLKITEISGSTEVSEGNLAAEKQSSLSEPVVTTPAEEEGGLDTSNVVSVDDNAVTAIEDDVEKNALEVSEMAFDVAVSSPKKALAPAVAVEDSKPEIINTVVQQGADKTAESAVIPDDSCRERATVLVSAFPEGNSSVKPTKQAANGENNLPGNLEIVAQVALEVDPAEAIEVEMSTPVDGDTGPSEEERPMEVQRENEEAVEGTISDSSAPGLESVSITIDGDRPVVTSQMSTVEDNSSTFVEKSTSIVPLEGDSKVSELSCVEGKDRVVVRDGDLAESIPTLLTAQSAAALNVDLDSNSHGREDFSSVAISSRELTPVKNEKKRGRDEEDTSAEEAEKTAKTAKANGETILVAEESMGVKVDDVKVDKKRCRDESDTLTDAHDLLKTKAAKNGVDDEYAGNCKEVDVEKDDIVDENIQPTTEGKESKPKRYKKRKIALFLGYSGAGYQGMQRNPGAITIEGELEEALFRAGAIAESNYGDPRKVDWMRAARTDKGVSAVGQVVSGCFFIDPPGFVERVNSHLPQQIRLYGYKRVTASFNAKKLCDRRKYEYVLPVYAFDPAVHLDRESARAQAAKEENSRNAVSSAKMPGEVGAAMDVGDELKNEGDAMIKPSSLEGVEPAAEGIVTQPLVTSALIHRENVVIESRESCSNGMCTVQEEANVATKVIIENQCTSLQAIQESGGKPAEVESTLQAPVKVHTQEMTIVEQKEVTVMVETSLAGQESVEQGTAPLRVHTHEMMLVKQKEATEMVEASSEVHTHKMIVEQKNMTERVEPSSEGLESIPQATAPVQVHTHELMSVEQNKVTEMVEASSEGPESIPQKTAPIQVHTWELRVEQKKVSEMVEAASERLESVPQKTAPVQVHTHEMLSVEQKEVTEMVEMSLEGLESTTQKSAPVQVHTQEMISIQQKEVSEMMQASSEGLEGILQKTAPVQVHTREKMSVEQKKVTEMVEASSERLGGIQQKSAPVQVHTHEKMSVEQKEVTEMVKTSSEELDSIPQKSAPVQVHTYEIMSSEQKEATVMVEASSEGLESIPKKGAPVQVNTHEMMSIKQKEVTEMVEASSEGLESIPQGVVPVQVHEMMIVEQKEATQKVEPTSEGLLSPEEQKQELDEKVRKSTYKFGEEEYNRLNRILHSFVGSHNFHNFTARVKADDPSAQRYIVSFEAEEVFTMDGIEFVRCTVVGQSFMLHQIRKMIGLAVAIMRGNAPESFIATALRRDTKVNVPMAPELGLFLEECYYPSYNNRFIATHEEVSLKDFVDNVKEFKKEFIYPHIASTESRDSTFALWLHSLNDRHFPELVAAREQENLKKAQ